MINKILEKTGIIDLIFYITAIGYWIFFWFVFNIVFHNVKKTEEWKNVK